MDAKETEAVESFVPATINPNIHNYQCGHLEYLASYRTRRETDGVYGGRFSGAGFKGACVALVDPEKKDSIEKAVTEKYLAEFPQYKDTFQVFFVRSDEGARFV